MSAWVLIPCLAALRDEYNRAAPGRDKGADGSIGDTNHSSSSDHSPDEDSIVLRARDSDGVNEVHALDIDSSGPWPQPGWFDQSVNRIVDRHRRGQDDRLEYVIWNRRIASRSHGWVWRAYTGTADPHTNHAHFSARYTSAEEADTSPWGVFEEDTVTKDEFLALLKDRDVRRELATAVLAHDPGLTADGKVPAGGVQNYGATFKENPTVAPAWSIGRAQVAADLGYQNRAKLDLVLAQLAALSGKDFTDEQQIVAAVLAGLNPQLIAAAIPQELAGQVADELAARLKA